MLNNWKVYYIRVSIGPILSFWGLISLTRNPNMPGMRLWHEWKKPPSRSLGMMLSKMLVGQVPSTQVYEEIHLTKYLNCGDRFSPKGWEVDQSQAAPMSHFHTFSILTWKQPPRKGMLCGRC
jgi:hypothetical protein